MTDYDKVSPYLNFIEEQADRTLVCQNAELYLSLLQKENVVVKIDLESASDSTDGSELRQLKLLCEMALNDLKEQKKSGKKLANAKKPEIYQNEFVLEN